MFQVIRMAKRKWEDRELERVVGGDGVWEKSI